jgi:hypothetical protein
MLKLKHLIKELFGLQDDLFGLLTDKRSGWGMSNYVPISIPIVKKLVGNTTTAKAAHATDIDNLPKLLSLQGKKKGISTFSALDERSIIMSGAGVATGGGVIVILSGDILFQDKLDIMSIVDKSGRRWIRVEKIFGDKTFVVANHLSPQSKEILKKEHNKDFITNKEKQYFIKDYIDTATKLMLQNKDVFIEKYLKSNQYSKVAGSVDFAEEWNEVILTKINIEAIALIKDSRDLRLFNSAEIEFLQKKYKNSEIITIKEIGNFLKKHGIKIQK